MSNRSNCSSTTLGGSENTRRSFRSRSVHPSSRSPRPRDLQSCSYPSLVCRPRWHRETREGGGFSDTLFVANSWFSAVQVIGLRAASRSTTAIALAAAKQATRSSLWRLRPGVTEASESQARHLGSTTEFVVGRSYLTCLARNSNVTPPKLMMSPSCKCPTEIGRSLTFVPLVEAKSLRV